MSEQLLACVKTNFKHSMRNWLPLVVLGFSILMALFTVIFMQFASTDLARLSLMKQIVMQITGIGFWYTGAVALLSL